VGLFVHGRGAEHLFDTDKEEHMNEIGTVKPRRGPLPKPAAARLDAELKTYTKPSVREAVCRLAAERGQTAAEVVRQALDQFLAAARG
jgi:hypothetical protein